MEDKKIITVLDNEGNEINCEVLFTCDSKETNKSYIVYTDNQIDENGQVKAYAATYDKTGDNMQLEEIKTDKEWTFIETVLQTIQEGDNASN